MRKFIVVLSAALLLTAMLLPETDACGHRRPRPPPPSPPPLRANQVSADFFDPRTFVQSPGLVLCEISGAAASAAMPTGCYARIPAVISMDMQMFHVDNPENCACGIATQNPESPNSFFSPSGTNEFKFFDATTLYVEFVVWDIQVGRKLRSLHKFTLNPDLNTKSFLEGMLTDAPGAVQSLAGFYGTVNDFNPADWIVNASREVTFISFSVIITYREKSGDPLACNAETPDGKSNVQGKIFAVPSCAANGILDPQIEWNTYPFRVFQNITKPAYTYKVAMGSSSPGGDAPGGSHPVGWFNSTFGGPGQCQTSADCDNGYTCDYGSLTCQQCVNDLHCVRFNTASTKAVCVRNNGRRVCQYVVDDYGEPTPGVTPPDAIVDCSPQCQGQFCVKGKCVDCRDFNDCELSFSTKNQYSKVCNSTNQCLYVFVAPAGKTENRALIIGVAAGAAACVVVLVAAVIVVVYRRYAKSRASYQQKMDERDNTFGTIQTNALFEGGNVKRSHNPLYEEVELAE